MSLLCCWPTNSNTSRGKHGVGEDSPHSENKADSGRPSKTDMATDALLIALEAVSETIPIPAAGLAAKAAIRLIEMCQQARDSLENADELSKRIRALSSVMVQSLSGKPVEEISEDLKRDIEKLQGDLHHIERTLQDISKQHRMVIFLFKDANGKAVNECLTRLDGSLVNFELSRQIHSDTVLKKIENDIKAQHRMLDATWKNTEEIKAILRHFIPEFRQDSKPMLRKTQFPPRSSIFHGRDELVSRLASKLASVSIDDDRGTFVSLLGPGGMGKTSVGLAVMEHPAVEERFGEFNRYWIPCVKAESVALLLDTLYDSLCIGRKTGKTLDDIVHELEPPSGELGLQPFRVLLLDNFETPWNLGGEEREEVESILRSLMRIPRVAILITMRAGQPPIEGWEEVRIPNLDQEASAKIYTEIYPKTSIEGLYDLLDAVGYLPLAVNLIANYARTNGATPAKLLVAWRCEGTAMLSLGELEDDADNKINRSIRLSIDSPRMKKSSDSLKMLILLALFPAGIATSVQQDWFPNSINSLKALSVLSSVALIEKRDEIVFVIPVIRSYVLYPNNMPPKIFTEMREHIRRTCCALLAKHKSEPGNGTFPRDKKFISSQEVNLQSILLDATSQPDAKMVQTDVLEALLTLSWHQYWTHPRFELIKHTLFVSECAKNEEYIARSLECYGEICRYLDQYDDAIEKLVQAHDKFLALNYNSAAARCTLRIVECRTFKDPSFSENLFLIHRAQSEYSSKDTFGQACCTYYLGVVHFQRLDHHDALSALQQAKAKFEELGKPFQLAQCLYLLSRVYHDGPRNETTFQSDSLSMALCLQYEALELFTKCDTPSYTAVSSVILAEILKDMHSYDKALQTTLQSLEMSKSLGSPSDVALGFERCGEILLEMGDYDAAQDALQKALVALDEIDESFQKQIRTKACNRLLSRLRGSKVLVN